MNQNQIVSKKETEIEQTTNKEEKNQDSSISRKIYIMMTRSFQLWLIYLMQYVTPYLAYTPPSYRFIHSTVTHQSHLPDIFEGISARNRYERHGGQNLQPKFNAEVAMLDQSYTYRTKSDFTFSPCSERYQNYQLGFETSSPYTLPQGFILSEMVLCSALVQGLSG